MIGGESFSAHLDYYTSKRNFEPDLKSPTEASFAIDLQTRDCGRCRIQLSADIPELW